MCFCCAYHNRHKVGLPADCEQPAEGNPCRDHHVLPRQHCDPVSNDVSAACRRCGTDCTMHICA